MTGRELIIFILENNLENVSIFDGDTLPGLMTLDEAAVKWHSGRNTLKALFAVNVNMVWRPYHSRISMK